MRDEDPLLRLLDESRSGHDRAVRERERVLRAVAEEGATMVGVLVDLAEGGSPVVVATVDGRSHHATIAGLGGDFCVLRPARGPLVYLAMAGIASVRPPAGSPRATATGDRYPSSDLRLVELLADLAADRPRVVVTTTAGTSVAGELRAVGTDVATIALDGDQRARCFVATAAILEVVVTAAG